jgi:hypothetical protein
MSKNDKARGSGKSIDAPAAKPKRKRRTLVRKTRYLALEQRIVFDGALAADIVDKNAQVDAAKSQATAPESTLPVVDWTQTAGKPGADGKPEGAPASTDKFAEEKGTQARPEPSAGRSQTFNRVVFVDTSVSGYQARLAEIDATAAVVLIDPTRDGVEQISRYLSTEKGVDSIHFIAHAADGALKIGTSSLDAVSMQAKYGAQFAEIATHLSADASIVVHDADAAKGGPAHATAAKLADLTATDLQDSDRSALRSESDRTEVVFIDKTLPDYESLLAGINNPDARVVVLDASRDAIDQMADYLDGMRDVDAVHIISHGSAGNLILTGYTYSVETLSREYSMDLARIGRAMSADGDILLYGCDIGKGSAGELFMAKVAEMTGADIAASLDKTGATSLGGNWILEVGTGAIDARNVLALMQDKYDFLLTLPPINTGGATLNFDGANRTLVSGTNLAPGAVYKYTNVVTIAGTQVDAYVTITGITNATLVSPG